ncbi:MAG: transglycosylase [Erythrobacter sp.]|nr:transglycosylase [Erythrobacter sp.]
MLACCAAQVQADVLEIGAEGARWIAGPQAIAPTPGGGGAPVSVESVPIGVPPQYAAKVAELSARYNLSPTLIEALVWQESRWQAGAVSPKGARGLAQLMPGTAHYLGVDPADPNANLEGGARYLREQLDRFGGDLEKALAAYNAGPGRVERAGGVPSIRETRQYVAAIMGRLSARLQAQE